MTRRSFLVSASALAAATPAKPAKSQFGVATTCYMTVRKFRDTLEFIDHCHAIGAAGAQTALTSLGPAYLDQVERRVKDTGLYLEVMSGLPKVDMGTFVQTMEAAKRVGALCARSACLSGRRYETYGTLEEWKKFVADSNAAVARAVPIAAKLKMPFAIENHKDWTVDEMVPLLKRYSSEYFGVCLDTGNNISLLDDPMEVIERLAPYALSTHIKDMGVAPYADGFLLAEVTLGTGLLDVKRAMAIIQSARPKTRMTLEMITRDPLKVPALTDKYWATFADRNGLKLARTLRMVEEKKQKLPMLSTLPRDEQAKAEDANVRKCLAYVPA